MPATHINPEVFTHPNNYPVGDNNQEVDFTPIQFQPYQRKQWTEALREHGSNIKLKQVQLNKLNRLWYTLNFGL